MATPVFAISEAIAFGWEKTKKHFGFMLLVMLVWVGIFIGLAIVRSLSGMPDFIFQIAQNLVVSPLLTLGLIKIALKITNDEKPEMNDLFSGGSLLLNYLGMALISVAVLIVAALPLIVIMVLAIGISSFDVAHLKSVLPGHILLIMGAPFLYFFLLIFLFIRFLFAHWILV